jgi:hypothetical protein
MKQLLRLIKHSIALLFLALLIVLPGPSFAGSPIRHPKDDLQQIINKLILECRQLRNQYQLKESVLNDSLGLVIKSMEKPMEVEKKLQLFFDMQEINAQKEKLWQDFESDITKTRYLKGIEIIRILYDKVLSLDHHFSSVRTFSEINKISNPNNYPEFSNLKELLKKSDKKGIGNLTPLLGNNLIVSVIQSLTGLWNSGLNKEDREKEMQQIECIMDFTLRMNTDLNTIFFETSYLQNSNTQIKEDIERVFKDYVKPIGYLASLEDCRNNDDWDELKGKLDAYLAKVNQNGGKIETHKLQVNLEFSVDRLLQFIVTYNNFIDDGTRFYQKFKTILNSYENKEQCGSKIPMEYKKLTEDVENSIKKFTVAYKPVEVNGTKMKELLYGLDE